MNLLSVLHVERAYKLKKKEIQRLFEPVCGQGKRLHILECSQQFLIFFVQEKSLENTRSTSENTFSVLCSVER